MHIFMIGDSVFDNGVYVRSGEPEFQTQVAALLPKGGRVSSAARDGAVIAGVHEQLARLSKDATHIVVSAGGNDALQVSNLLDARVASGNASGRRGEFQATIRGLARPTGIDRAARRGLHHLRPSLSGCRIA